MTGKEIVEIFFVMMAMAGGLGAGVAFALFVATLLLGFLGAGTC